jgi:hypothetical protein
MSVIELLPPVEIPGSEEVVAVLPGEWRGVASRAGQGSWCVLRRA